MNNDSVHSVIASFHLCHLSLGKQILVTPSKLLYFISVSSYRCDMHSCSCLWSTDTL